MKKPRAQTQCMTINVRKVLTSCNYRFLHTSKTPSRRGTEGRHAVIECWSEKGSDNSGKSVDDVPVKDGQSNTNPQPKGDKDNDSLRRDRDKKGEPMNVPQRSHSKPRETSRERHSMHHSRGSWETRSQKMPTRILHRLYRESTGESSVPDSRPFKEKGTPPEVNEVAPFAARGGAEGERAARS